MMDKKGQITMFIIIGIVLLIGTGLILFLRSEFITSELEVQLELDKVSDTSKGKEIINLLIHLTDPSQNSHFNDKYYGDIPFDLSKAIFTPCTRRFMVSNGSFAS